MNIKIKRELYKIGVYLTAFEGVQEGLGKRVEVRILHHDVKEQSDEVVRFLAEIKSLAVLDHPSILRVLDSGVRNGHLYYVTDYKEGVRLAELLKPGTTPITLQDKVRMLIDLAGAVRYMHQKGVIHRGLDAHALCYNRENKHAYISQFNFAKNLNIRDLTGAGVGHVLTLPTTPELGLGLDTDARVDIYLLGVLMYRLFAATSPYESSVMATLFNRKDDPPRPASLSELVAGFPSSLDAVAARAVEVRPDDRFPDAQALVDALKGAFDQLMLDQWSSSRKVRRASTDSLRVPGGLSAELTRPDPPPPPLPAPAPTRAGSPGRGRRAMMVLIAILCVALLGGGWVYRDILQGLIGARTAGS